MWDAVTGVRVATPGLLVGFDDMCVDVAWHPTQHLVALVAFGEYRQQAPCHREATHLLTLVAPFWFAQMTTVQSCCMGMKHMLCEERIQDTRK